MILLRQPRLWTALVVAGLAAYTIARAVTITGFAWNEMRADQQSAAERLSPFVDAGPTKHLARVDLLQYAYAETDDVAQRAEQLSDLLTATPLDSGAWAALAQAWFASEMRTDQILSALAISTLTGPNELRVMSYRAEFVVPLWANAPPSVRKALINDLLGGWAMMTEARRLGFRTKLQRADAKTRQQIYAALLLAGKNGALIAKELDLSLPKSMDAP